MVKHAVEIGWTPLTPDDARAKRGGEAGMFFRDELEAKLAEFNPWLTHDAVRSIVETLDAMPSTIDGNREMLAWLRGERQWYDEAEKRHRRGDDHRLRERGDQRVPRHLGVEDQAAGPQGQPGRRDVRRQRRAGRASSSTRTRRTATPSSGPSSSSAATSWRRRSCSAAPQFFNVTHLLDYWYGVTWNANRRDMARWKQTPEETYRFAVQSFFEPTEFLRTLQHWILFYVQDGETRKSILRQHQRRAIDAIVDALRRPHQEARSGLAHAGLGQDVHAADGRAS